MNSQKNYKKTVFNLQYSEERRECNTWDQSLCPSPCDRVKCPAFAKCQDISNKTDPLYECACQLGTIKKVGEQF